MTSTFPRHEGDSVTSFVLNQANALKDLGWDVTVLTPHHSGASNWPKVLGDDSIQGYGTRSFINNIPVIRFRYAPEACETLCYNGGALINLRKRPLDLLKLPLFLIGQLFAAIKEIRKSKKEGNPYDAIHAHWLIPQGFIAVLLKKIFAA